jgi:hypothetical protein
VQKNEDVWDDSALQRAFQRGVASFQVRLFGAIFSLVTFRKFFPAVATRSQVYFFLRKCIQNNLISRIDDPNRISKAWAGSERSCRAPRCICGSNRPSIIFYDPTRDLFNFCTSILASW